MAKLTKMLLIVFFVHTILVLTGVVAIPGSTLYSFLSNPSDWDISSLLSLITDLAALAGVTGVVVGTLFRNDLVTFAGLTLVLLSFGQAFAELWNIVNASWGYEAAVFIVSPLVLIYVFTCLAFWRGQKD